MFRRAFLGGILTAAVLFAPAADAAMLTTWDFTGGKSIEGWQIDGLDVRQGPDGLHIRGTGVMMRLVDATHHIDAVNLVFARSVASPGVFAWHRQRAPGNEFMQLGINLSTGGPVNMEIPLHKIPEWDPWADIVGLRFETNEEIVLSGIEFKGWSMLEKLQHGWTSFWKIDQTLAFSINFLWGPLVAFTPQEIVTLYDTQPPSAWSAYRIILPILLIIGLLCLAYYVFERARGRSVRKRATTIFFVAFAVFWVLGDLRMGYEFMHNYAKDLQTYGLAEPGSKKFRNLLSFHDGLEQNIDLLTSVDTYVVYAPDGSPMRKMAGYRTYPISRPAFDDEPSLEQSVFYVFYDSRVSVNEKNELVKNGVVVSRPGRVASRIDDNAYIFIVP